MALFADGLYVELPEGRRPAHLPSSVWQEAQHGAPLGGAE